MSFIRKHWLGQYSLGFSFWFIFIFFGIAFHLISFYLLKQASDTNSTHVAAMTIYQVTGGLILYPWQAIGLLRSAEFHYKKFGWPIILYLVQASVLISFIGIASHFVGLVQTSFVDRSFKEFKLKAEPPQYTIQLAGNESQLILQGTFDFGITEAVSLFLKAHPDINQVVLESEGGQIYEGRGLSILFHQYELDTYSYSYCLSACTTAFIGGARRYLGGDAKLGFHQYAYESKRVQTFEKFYSLENEQNKDVEIYRSKKISEDFIQQIFKKPNSEIWYPDRETLLQAGVVTATVNQ